MTANSDLVIFKNLVAYYVQRQRLVVLAMLDICPEILAWPQNRPSILGIDLEPYIEANWERINREGAISIQSGTWKHDWRYWQHGIGCRLTHLHTKEVLEWDAPDPDAFHLDWLFEHLDWRIEYELHDPFVKAYSPHKLSFKDFIDTLMQSGLVQAYEDSHMYKLIGY